MGEAPAKLPTALWFVSGFAAAAPAWLLFMNAENRLPQVASTLLVFAGVAAFVMGAAGASVSSPRRSLPAGAVVVLLCAAALAMLEVSGRVSPGGWVMFGGAAGVLAALASALTMRPGTGRGNR